MSLIANTSNNQETPVNAGGTPGFLEFMF